MFINTAAEFPNPNDPVHKAAAAHKRKNRDIFRDLAGRAGARAPRYSWAQSSRSGSVAEPSASRRAARSRCSGSWCSG